MSRCVKAVLVLALMLAAPFAGAQVTSAAASRSTAPVAVAGPAQGKFDPALAQRLGADERGMRRYVLVILKSGPTPVTDPEQRKTMFAGHFANMERLVRSGHLVMAGPFSSDPDGWRGLFLLAVDELDEAKRLTETDPVIASGEMVADYHRWYGSAGAMMLPGIHETLAKKP